MQTDHLKNKKTEGIQIHVVLRNAYLVLWSASNKKSL